MPSQLLSRLQQFLNEDVRTTVMALRNKRRVDVLGPVPTHPSHPNEPASNKEPHWPDGGHFGDAIDPTQSVVIHGTGGWPSHASAGNFRGHYDCTNYWDYSERFGWHDVRGIGPQYFVDPNGTAYSLIGPEKFAGSPLVTWHAEEMNGLSVGIENSDVADSGSTPTDAGNAKYWSPLSTATEDLAGRKAYLLLHPASDPDAAIIWRAVLPHYVGAGDLNAAGTAVNTEFGGWKNMLFTERNYRSLALLCRVIAATLGIPKNFPLFPYLTRAHDCRSEVLFRQMLLADPACDAIATKLGTTTAAVRANDAAYTEWFHDADYTRTYRDGSTQARNNRWTSYFGVDRDGSTKSTPCFKGFISHAINGDHPCPGPMFDWYRLAREVWDSWWYPFDLLGGSSTPVAAPRPYRAARRNTPVIDYYWDAGETSAAFEQVREPATSPSPFTPYPDRFRIAGATQVHALANGVIVAARVPNATSSTNPGFLLTRHEVYSRSLVGTGDMPLDYDHPPTIVWSLISYLSPAGARFDQLTNANPEWLNRAIIRASECRLTVDFWNANHLGTTKPLLGAGVSYTPVREAPATATGEQINLDGDAYRSLLDGLASATVRLFPLESGDVTPVRLILGDFIGTPGEMSPGVNGIQIEIFSKEELPVPGAIHRAASVAGESWYKAACTSLRHEGSVGKDLPADGNAWHYPVMSFLDWLNPITWKSEWLLHGIKAADGSPAPAPARRNMRIVIP
jgi:hypothetical protein